MMLYQPPKRKHRSAIVEELIELRLAWQITSRDLAKRVGVSPTTLRHVELDKKGICLERLEKWADALGYEIVLRPKGWRGNKN